MKFDHVELYVPDRHAAAEWYGRVLGFTVLEEHRHWAEDPRGPLMISNDGGDAKVALFTGPPQGDDALQGFKLIAFRVGAEEFLAFVEGSGAWRDPALSKADVQDHDGAFSVYFSDPWGNHLEVTTYDYEGVKHRLRSRELESPS